MSLVPHVALVARTDAADQASYLLLTPAGEAAWVERPDEATAFASMREAARMAARLPAKLRAFGLPRPQALAGEA